MIREISATEIENAVEKLFIDANYSLPQDIYSSIKSAHETETNPLAKDILLKLCDNILAAKEINVPICQDTGMAILLIELGQDVHISNGFLTDAVNKGVANAYINGYLRKSVVIDPLERVNSNDNTPAIIHTEIIKGDKIKITALPKGFGSENMSSIKMFNPTTSAEEIIDYVTSCVKNASSNPCPPVVVGVGIGGSFEYCAYLAKKALSRPIDVHNPHPLYEKLEKQMLEKINKLNIGPQGFGGDTTALAVNIEKYPTHIAGLPVAVNISCHVTRHKSIEI